MSRSRRRSDTSGLPDARCYITQMQFHSNSNPYVPEWPGIIYYRPGIGEQPSLRDTYSYDNHAISVTVLTLIRQVHGLPGIKRLNTY